jgi:hypothetical protein
MPNAAASFASPRAAPARAPLAGQVEMHAHEEAAVQRFGVLLAR